MRDRLGASRKVDSASAVTSSGPECARARRIRHCCSVTPWLRKPGRKRRMTASRARSNAIGSDCEKPRIGILPCLDAIACFLLPLVIYDAISQQPDARHLNLDNITGAQVFGRIQPCTRAARRTGQNDIAALERTERRQVADEIRD